MKAGECLRKILQCFITVLIGNINRLSDACCPLILFSCLCALFCTIPSYQEPFDISCLFLPGSVRFRFLLHNKKINFLFGKVFLLPIS